MIGIRLLAMVSLPLLPPHGDVPMGSLVSWGLASYKARRLLESQSQPSVNFIKVECGNACPARFLEVIDDAPQSPIWLFWATHS